MKKLLLLASFLLTAHHSFGYRMEYGGEVNIKEPVHDDIYISGGTVNIDAPIYGDLVVAGGTVNINDSVAGDILVAGGTVNFDGYAGDDIRCAGGRLNIRRNVAGHMALAGGEVMIDKGVTVNGLLAASGTLLLDGNVQGMLKASGGDMTLNGNVTGDADVRANKLTLNGNIGGQAVLAANEMALGPDASFARDVRYWTAKNKPDFNGKLKGAATYDENLAMQHNQWVFLGYATLFGVLWYICMALVMIMLLQYLFPVTFQKAAGNFSQHTARSLAYGLLFLVGVPILTVLFFITLIGIPIGVMLALLYAATLILATAITSVVITQWFNSRRTKHWHYWPAVFIALGIFVVIKILGMIPFLGWLFRLAVISIAFGALILNMKWKREKAVPVVEA